MFIWHPFKLIDRNMNTKGSFDINQGNYIPSVCYLINELRNFNVRLGDTIINEAFKI